MTGSASRDRLPAAAAGVAAALLGIGAGELAATLLAPSSSPFAVVGGFLIDGAPAWAKDTAIAWFGTGDKAALLTGIALVLLAAAGALGLLQRRFRGVGVAGFLVLGAAVAVLARCAPTPPRCPGCPHWWPASSPHSSCAPSCDGSPTARPRPRPETARQNRCLGTQVRSRRQQPRRQQPRGPPPRRQQPRGPPPRRQQPRGPPPRGPPTRQRTVPPAGASSPGPPGPPRSGSSRRSRRRRAGPDPSP